MASKKTPEINGGSMADISFLMLIFFLMVTTMDAQTGLSRRLPPIPDQNQKAVDQKVNRRNLLNVKINSRDAIFAGEQYISDVDQIEDIVIEFLTNPSDNEKLSAKKIRNIEGFGEYPVSEGVISLQNDRATSYAVYVEVQDVLVRAITHIRNDFSRTHFGMDYAQLDEDRQKIVRDAIPNTISESEPKDVSKSSRRR